MTSRRSIWFATTAGVVASAALGTMVGRPDGAWFQRLDKPAWQPPNQAFPIAWTALYAALAGSSATTLSQLAQRRDRSAFQGLATALAANLVLNTGWNVVFWRARKLGLAAAWAGALALSSADLVRRMAVVGSPRAAAVLAPYPAWCAFATALSTDLARRNS